MLHDEDRRKMNSTKHLNLFTQESLTYIRHVLLSAETVVFRVVQREIVSNITHLQD